MRHPELRALVAAAGLFTLVACGEKKDDRPAAPTAPAPSAPAASDPAARPTPEPASPAPAPAQAEPAAKAPDAPGSAETKPAGTKAAPKPVDAKPAGTTPVTTPAPKPADAKPVEAKPADTKPGDAKPADAKPAESAPTSAHAKVGPQKCKMCHRVEHDSWSASAHAAKGLDCEGCHGNGADYRSASVMRDRAKAIAAGLVVPTVATCKRCHADATPALLPNAHAHKGG
jgi:hypothetical protein